MAVVDDVPAMTVSGTATVAEDAIGTIDGTWDDASAGADGAAATIVLIGVTEYAIGADIALTEGTLNVANDGTWTFDPNTGLDQDTAQSVTFSVQVTDGDGDVASDNHTIAITDGAGPQDASPISLSVDEDDLPLGSDDTPESLSDSDTLTFTLGSDALASMVFDTDLTNLALNTDGLAGNDVTWSYVNATTITGTVDGQLAITLTLTPNLVAGTASVQATLSDNFLHTDSDDIQTNLNLGSVSVVATDIDGDTATGTVNVAVVDDVPVAIDPDMAFITNVTDALGSVTGVALDIDGVVANNVGADQTGTLTFANIAADGTDSGETVNNATIYLYSNGTTLIGSTLSDSDFDTVNADGSTQAFTAVLNGDTYDFTLQQQIDGGVTTFGVGDVGFDFEGGNDPYAYFDDTITGDANGDQDVLLTPIGGNTVNTNANEGGIAGGNSVGAGEAMRVDYVHGIAGDSSANVGGNSGYSNVANRDHTFDGHNLVNGASALFTNINGTTDILIKAFIDDDTSINVVGEPTDLTSKNITSVLIIYSGFSGTAVEGDTSILVGGVTYSLDWTGNDVVIGGVVADTEIAVFTDEGLTTVEYYHDDGATFKVGGFGASVPTPGELINLDFDLQLVDADGDIVVMEDGIQIQISPEDHEIQTGDAGVDDTLTAGTPGQAETLVGLAGDDTLIGNDGNDILIGGSGDDILTGNGGLDTFDWNLGDQGTLALPAIDTVTDFTIGEGDKLDLSDLLQGESADASTLDNYLSFNFASGNTTIDVSTSSGGDVTQQIVLQGVDITANNSLTDQQILQTLLDGGNLNVD